MRVVCSDFLGHFSPMTKDSRVLTVSWHRAVMSWSNKLFFVLFLFYPMWANAALTMFDCRDLGDGMRVVREEYIVHCDGVVYTFHCVAAASMLLVVVVIPVVVMWKMIHVSKQEDDEDDDEDDRERSERDYLARRITEQLAVPKRKVEDLIKDLTDHSSYSFLAQGFRPACAYWCVPALRMQLQPVFHCSSLSTLDPGSGR